MLLNYHSCIEFKHLFEEGDLNCVLLTEKVECCAVALLTVEMEDVKKLNAIAALDVKSLDKGQQMTSFHSIPLLL